MADEALEREIPLHPEDSGLFYRLMGARIGITIAQEIVNGHYDKDVLTDYVARMLRT